VKERGGQSRGVGNRPREGGYEKRRQSERAHVLLSVFSPPIGMSPLPCMQGEKPLPSHVVLLQSL